MFVCVVIHYGLKAGQPKNWILDHNVIVSVTGFYMKYVSLTGVYDIIPIFIYENK